MKRQRRDRKREEFCPNLFVLISFHETVSLCIAINDLQNIKNTSEYCKNQGGPE